jgi:hypothetical protein
VVGRSATPRPAGALGRASCPRDQARRARAVSHDLPVVLGAQMPSTMVPTPASARAIAGSARNRWKGGPVGRGCGLSARGIRSGFKHLYVVVALKNHEVRFRRGREKVFGMWPGRDLGDGPPAAAQYVANRVRGVGGDGRRAARPRFPPRIRSWHRSRARFSGRSARRTFSMAAKGGRRGVNRKVEFAGKHACPAHVVTCSW